MAQIDRALELDPFNPVTRARGGGTFLMARRHDDALGRLPSAARPT
jgi:hypothetical protein